MRLPVFPMMHTNIFARSFLNPSLRLIEQLARLSDGIIVFRNIIGIGRHAENHIEFPTRVFFAIDCQVSLRQAQVIEHVVLAKV